MTSSSNPVVAHRFVHRPIEVDAVFWDGERSTAPGIIDWINAQGADIVATFGREPGFSSSPIEDCHILTRSKLDGNLSIRGHCAGWFLLRNEMIMWMSDWEFRNRYALPDSGLTDSARELLEIARESGWHRAERSLQLVDRETREILLLIRYVTEGKNGRLLWTEKAKEHG